jgi:hypothetical protein
MLKTGNKDLFVVKTLPVLPENTSYADGVFGADCAGQGREVIISTAVVF